MNEHARHVVALIIAATVAIIGAWLRVNENMFYSVSMAIITGEYALSRSGSPRDRRDEPPANQEKGSRGQ